MNIQPIKEDVKHILSETEQTRDDDYALYYFFLLKKGYKPSEMTAHELLKLQSKEALPSIQTISRIRRLLQQENVALRGSKWDERHNQQEQVHEDLGYEKTKEGMPGTIPG